MRAIRALARSSLLLALALVGLLAFLYFVVGACLVFPLPRVVLSLRRLTSVSRTLAGVSSEGVYWPPPEPLKPEPDGLYRVGNRLVRNPWWHEFERRLDWVTDDPGARRDLNYLVFNFLVGTVLAGLGPATLVTGVWLLTTTWWPAGIVAAATGIAAAHPLVRLHNRWTDFMLRAKKDGRMFRLSAIVRHSLKQWWHATALAGLALANLVVTVATLILGFLPHIWGLWFIWPPLVVSGRTLTNLRRELITDWTPYEIPQPYLPEPPPPQIRADGMYRHGRQLFKKPTIPRMHARYGWVMKDRATWRDAMSAPPQVLRVQAKVSHWLLAPTRAAVLAQRVRRLTETRTEATDAQAAELRRIERDLHDGAQARLVALGMTLGAVERLIDDNPALAKELVAKSRTASADALVELRDLVRGIHPPVLAERGLTDAIRALALDTPMPVTVTGATSTKLDAPIESAAYFAVTELLVNAVKHAHANTAEVHIEQSPDLLITVTDDGRGGADPTKGTGLTGLHRRLAPFDGTLTIESPPGGPTKAEIHLPTSGG
ncbi:sensor histidine kinase [Kibdelosporangium lantanae]|uniref:histidine kinase n=1 Tax=Kibdelosporangium lantanae TaxID=1497396 RepID=A0ABW3M5W5_9PSEU